LFGSINAFGKNGLKIVFFFEFQDDLI
jgi:hypothetical protein